jgi:hypothetical protein
MDWSGTVVVTTCEPTAQVLLYVHTVCMFVLYTVLGGDNGV